MTRMRRSWRGTAPSRSSRPTSPEAVGRNSFPFDAPETLVAHERVEDADRAARLAAVAQVGVARVAAVPQVLHRERVHLLDPPGPGNVEPHDVVVAAARAADPAHEILAAGDVERH